MKMTRIAILMSLIIAFTQMSGYAQKKSGMKTKVIAHRGAWKNTGFPQNSMSALKAAIAMGCFASECDIWMTADSVLVVNHDPSFYDLSIETTTYDELLKKKYPNGESIATLKDFLDVVAKQKKTRLVLDIKPSKINKERSIITAKKSYEMASGSKAKKMIDYILFDYDACLALEKLSPKANIAYLNGDKSPDEVAADGLWGIDYSFRVFQKNESWLNDAKRNKLTINVWTVNDKALAETYINEGVDFITTDEPEMLLKMLNK